MSYRYPNKIIIELKEREAFAIINKDPLVILDRDCFVLPIDDNFNNYDNFIDRVNVLNSKCNLIQLDNPHRAGFVKNEASAESNTSI